MYEIRWTSVENTEKKRTRIFSPPRQRVACTEQEEENEQRRVVVVKIWEDLFVGLQSSGKGLNFARNVKF